jgi:hypothetical protein
MSNYFNFNIENLNKDLFQNSFKMSPLKDDFVQMKNYDEIKFNIKENNFDDQINKKPTIYEDVNPQLNNNIINDESLNTNNNNNNNNNNNINENKNNKINEEEQIKEKKYKIKTDSNSIIKLPPNYSTDDEDEYKLINIFNEPLENGWEEATKNKNCTVYKKTIAGSDGVLLKTYGELNYPISTILNVLLDHDNKKKWDKTYSKHLVIEDFPEENNYKTWIEYNYMKFPAFMTDRDFVLQFKFWMNYNGNKNVALFFNSSVEHNDYPAKSNPIRAEMIIGGNYLEQIDNNLTKIYLINHADVKASTGKSIINSKAPDSPKNFIGYLIEGCKLYEKGKLK